ncbi:hypothetical protein ACRALDRAFT_1032936 [Sodiomyces alcalophilus JCM 7366]|uniref:uncharacterized protein n=1 Tax=Sodiomyces alcalophilus JCM 7366 TaxID=591952 RepID=UPI0039B6AF65
MVLRLRLARFGRRNQPFYNIVVAHARHPLEVIGTYDPVPRNDPYDETTKRHKNIQLDTLRARYWIGVGAQPSDTVWRLLSMVRTFQFPVILLSRILDSKPHLANAMRSMQIGILEPKYGPNGFLNQKSASKSMTQPPPPSPTPEKA